MDACPGARTVDFLRRLSKSCDFLANCATSRHCSRRKPGFRPLRRLGSCITQRLHVCDFVVASCHPLDFSALPAGR